MRAMGRKTQRPIYSKTARKRLFIVALSPSRLKISDYLLYSSVSSLKGSF